jgi:PIN domain nuclease of toxin-antitoxin system
MNLLLDTQVLLWWLGDDRRLGARARAAIADEANLVAVSAASAWEVAIKSALRKLHAPSDLQGAVADSGFEELPISIDHALLAGGLPPHHTDPFDRMLVAQAVAEALVLVTADERLAAYDVEILSA